MKDWLEGRIAIITRASAGIGAALAAGDAAHAGPGRSPVPAAQPSS